MKMIVRLTAVILCLLTAVSCTRTPQEKFQQSIKRFSEGDHKEQEGDPCSFLLRQMLQASCDETVSEKSRYVHGDVLIEPSDNGSSWTLIGERRVTLDPDDLKIENVRYAHTGKQRTLITTTEKLRAYSSETGEALSVPELPEGEKPISAISHGGVIYLYAGTGLYRKSEREEGFSLLNEVDVKPTYSKSFIVVLAAKGDYLALTAGIAGSYRCAVVDLKEEKPVLSGQILASSIMRLKDSSLVCVKGTSGDWKLTEVSFPDGDSRVVRTFDDLRDLILYPEGYIYINSDGLYYADGKEWYSPLSLWMKPLADGRLLVRGETEKHICNRGRLQQGINTILTSARGYRERCIGGKKEK